MWPLLLILIVAAALLYLAYLHTKLAKEVRELKQASLACMTLEDWEEEVQPKIEALQQAQVTTGRHVSMLAASVRALEQTTSQNPIADDGDVSLPRCEEEGDFDATAAEAAHTEDQIQAMLSSMANMFGMTRPPDGDGLPQFANAQLFVASSKRPASTTFIEEAEDDAEMLEEVDETDD